MADVTLSMGALQNFAQGVSEISGLSRDTMLDSLTAIDVRDRGLVEDLVVGACRAAQQASGAYAGQFYRGMSLLQTGADFDARALDAFDEQATRIAVRGIYRQCRLGDDELDEERLASAIGDRVEFEANRAAKVGVWKNGQRDSRDVRYARVPTGPETCAWCLMTAGLGFWFMTAESASHTHRGCDCAIVPEIGGIHDVHIDGYDSTVYRDMWRRANALRANGDIPQEWSDHIADVRALRASEDRPYRDDTNGTLYVMRKMYGLK